MRVLAVLIAAICAPVLFAGEDALIAPVPSDPSVVKSVNLQGGSALVRLSTRVGQPLDQDKLRKDVQALWATGQFTDIQVKTKDDRDGTSVVFAVVEKPRVYLHFMRIEPHSFGLAPNLSMGTPIDEVQAQRVAGQIRRKLIEKGYPNPVVEPELVPYGKNKADLLLHVKPGDSVEVKHVDIGGDTVFPPKDVARALRALKSQRIVPPIPWIWHGYVMRPAYSEAAVQSDLARLQSFYIERGYFDARVSIDDTSIEGGKANLKFFVKAGPHYKVRQIEVSGNDIPSQLEAPKYGLFQSSYICSCMMNLRREAEKRGIVDFNSHMSFRRVSTEESAEPMVDVNAEVEEGRSYTVNRIELQGLKHYKEGTVRKNLLLDEGDILDETVLRKSIARLNESQLFDTIDESQVAINTDDKTGTADVTIPLHERKRGMWNFSGPLGPISLEGPLQAMVATRLPPWGQGLFELSTYYISFNLLGFVRPIASALPLGFPKQGIFPILSLMRPFSPGAGWMSGFMIAPQLGWQASLLSYGTAQTSSRLVPLLMGSQHLTPQLPVTFERAAGDGVLLCDPPKPRLHTVRAGAAILLQLLGSSPII